MHALLFYDYVPDMLERRIPWRADHLAQVETFARNDPYVVQGLVTAWRVREWSAVVGSIL